MEDILDKLGYAIRYIIVGVLFIPWAIFTVLVIFILDLVNICINGESIVIERLRDYLKE